MNGSVQCTRNSGYNQNLSPVVELNNKPFKINCLDFITLLYWLNGAITPIHVYNVIWQKHFYQLKTISYFSLTLPVKPQTEWNMQKINFCMQIEVVKTRLVKLFIIHCLFQSAKP